MTNKWQNGGTTKKNPNHTSPNENYFVPCICLRAIWHMHGSMWRATRMTRDRKRIVVAHCVIALWRHYYYALAKFYCRGRVEGHFSGYPSHKTYTCEFPCICLMVWHMHGTMYRVTSIHSAYSNVARHIAPCICHTIRHIHGNDVISRASVSYYYANCVPCLCLNSTYVSYHTSCNNPRGLSVSLVSSY